MLPPEARRELLRRLTEDESADILGDWSLWAREKQLPPPGDWRIWLVLAGRGFGKTLAITQWALAQAKAMPGSRGALVAPTAGDARDVLVEGVSGILTIAPPDFMPMFEPSRRRLTFPNGSRATLFSADEPNRLRGPQHHWAVCDEIAAWQYLEAFDMLLLACGWAKIHAARLRRRRARPKRVWGVL
ncbi:MAG: terminase family protein [Anaerolineae bacterium]